MSIKKDDYKRAKERLKSGGTEEIRDFTRVKCNYLLKLLTKCNYFSNDSFRD